MWCCGVPVRGKGVEVDGYGAMCVGVVCWCGNAVRGGVMWWSGDVVVCVVWRGIVGGEGVVW